MIEFRSEGSGMFYYSTLTDKRYTIHGEEGETHKIKDLFPQNRGEYTSFIVYNKGVTDEYKGVKSTILSCGEYLGPDFNHILNTGLQKVVQDEAEFVKDILNIIDDKEEGKHLMGVLNTGITFNDTQSDVSDKERHESSRAAISKIQTSDIEPTQGKQEHSQQKQEHSPGKQEHSNNSDIIKLLGLKGYTYAELNKEFKVHHRTISNGIKYKKVGDLYYSTEEITESVIDLLIKQNT